MRSLVTVHPNYRGMASWDQRETSDIVYRDTGSHLTRLFIRLGYLENIWVNTEPEYFIEVKTTTGNCADRFYMSDNQYNRVRPSCS
jgi:hypothetical protein